MVLPVETPSAIPNGMYEGGANTVQMLLIFVGPLAGMVIAALSSGDGHLRASGGIALAAAVLFVLPGLIFPVSAWPPFVSIEGFLRHRRLSSLFHDRLAKPAASGQRARCRC